MFLCSDDVEQKVYVIVKNVLGKDEDFPKTSTFFELGGQSLLVGKLINNIMVNFSVQLSYKDIFQYSTVPELAEIIEEKLTDINEMDKYLQIPKAERKKYYPMSSAQKRMFLLNQIEGIGSSYNLPRMVELPENIDFERFEKAVNAIIIRHEVFRTGFELKDGELIQKIYDNIAMKIELVKAEDSKVNDMFSEFVQPFNLEKPPLLRMIVIKTQDRNLLFVDLHHIIADGLSMNILLGELKQLYRGETLKKLELQYKDYSEWMRCRDLTVQKNYWLNELKEDPPVLMFPTDYKRPPRQSFHGKTVTKSMPGKMVEALNIMKNNTGTTEFMILLSAFMITLSKYSRQEDIVIGTPVSGRSNKATENIIGMFVNTLALRSRPEGSKKYTDFLKEIKEICTSAYSNQEYPFEELIEAVNVKRDMSRNPLFDVMFECQRYVKEADSMKKMIPGTTDTEDGTAQFDLSMKIMINEKGGHDVILDYCSDLFYKDTAKRILDHYMIVLEAIIANREQSIKEIKMISAEEKEQITLHFNNTSKEYDKNKTVIDLFEEQVAKVPDNIAVEYEDKKVTYAKLNSMANSLAHQLRKLGVRPDDLVAVITDRNIEMIAGIFGIIKSGGAYIPIDPSYPMERILYMLEDSKPKAILLYQSEIDMDIPVIDLSDSSIWEDNCENPEKINLPKNLVYVIYTSGTTGKPKGVMLEHKGVVSMKHYLSNLYRVNEADKVLQFANYIFDAFVWEITMSLLNGATLVLIPSTAIYDVNKFNQYIQQKKITITLLPPQFYLQTNATGLKVLTTGGSASNPQIVKNACNNSRYINAYGPTENTVLATHWEYDFKSEIPHNIPIGKPIDNTKIYILNESLLCGIGVPGELCIVGDGLARGYLNRKKLTAEKFIPNPYGEGKLYCSGDLARWLPDGNIEYLGRIDEQVKLRSFRIELGEIESVLRSIKDVKDAAVILKQDQSENMAIYAYLVSDRSTNISEIRNQLQKILPEYMIPAYMIQIEAIPLTRSGKLNKKELSEIEVKQVREYTEPANKTEKMLCEVFGELLNVEKVGVNDTFFELGGDSLKYIQLVDKLKKRGYTIYISDIISNPTPKKLAPKCIKGMLKMSVTGGLDMNRIKPGVTLKNPLLKQQIQNYDRNMERNPVQNTYIPLIKQEYVVWMGKQNYITEEKPMMSANIARVKGCTDEEHIMGALRQLIKEQAVLRTAQLESQGLFAEYAVDDWQIPYLDQNDYDNWNDIIDEIDCLKYEFSLFGDNHLASKMFLLKIAEDEFEVRLYAHHAIWDGSSCEIFINRLDRLVNGLDEGLELKHSYRDYVEHSRELAQMEREAYRQKKEEVLREPARNFLEAISQQQEYVVQVCWKPEKEYIDNFNENPIKNFIKLYSELFVDLSHCPQVTKIPFILLINRRDDTNADCLGLHVDMIQVIYHLEEKCIYDVKGNVFNCNKFESRISNSELCDDLIDFSYYMFNTPFVDFMGQFHTKSPNAFIQVTEIEASSSRDRRIMCSTTDDSVYFLTPLHADNVTVLKDKLNEYFKWEVND